MKVWKYLEHVWEGGVFSKCLPAVLLVAGILDFVVLLLGQNSRAAQPRLVIMPHREPHRTPHLKPHLKLPRPEPRHAQNTAQDRVQALDPAKDYTEHPLGIGHHDTNYDRDSEFAERRARLERVCTDPRASRHARARTIRGNSQAGFTVCIVHKAASTVWMRLLMLINNKVHGGTSEEAVLSRNKWDLHRDASGKEESFNLYKRRDAIMRTHRVMTARNPYSRLWSAYVDKFLFPMFKVVGERIVKRYRANVTKTPCGHDVTFEEFIRYVVSEKNTVRVYSSHWLPVSDVCDPCTLKPDFIAKQETLGEDIKAIVQRLGLSYETDDMFVKAELETTIRDEVDVHIKGYEAVKQCMTKSEYLRRIWKGLMVNGYLQPDTEFPEKFEQLAFNATVVSNYILQMPNLVTDTAARNELRQKALVTAFQRIPERDLKSLQILYNRDFLMFNYSAVLSL